MKITDRNLRQLARMKERASLYQEAQIPLSTLIADLDFLLSACESLDPALEIEIRKEWAVLEELHAAALAKSHGLLDDAAQREVDRAIAEIQERIKAATGREGGG